MSYRQRDPYWRPDPYANQRHSYQRRDTYYEDRIHCACCHRTTDWIGAGRSDPNVLICRDCGTEQRFA